MDVMLVQTPMQRGVHIKCHECGGGVSDIVLSSIKLMVELMMSSVMIPTKSCQSGGLP
jgi:hypothetical protein